MGIKEDVFGIKGYSTDLKLLPGELAMLESLVHWHFEESVREKAKELTNQPLEQYHSKQLRHEALWTKKSRILPPIQVKMIRGLTFMKKLEEEFGPFGITSEEGVYPEEVYWRIVRPNEPGDVGSLHADRWFWDLGHGHRPGETCVKVWIPIHVEPGKSGLKVVPGSHLKTDWKYHGEKPPGESRSSYRKPVFDEMEESLDVIHLATKPGECVVFNDLLLHGGMVNAGTHTRISMEFMLFN